MKRLGTRLPVSEEEEGALRARLTELCGDATELTARRAALRRRFAAAGPYDADGVKRARRDGLRVRPFKGAANNAIRWGDQIADAERSLILELARRAQRRVRPIGGGEEAERRAAALTRLLDWAVGHLGAEWGRQLQIAATYLLVDTPAVALMGVGWERRPILGPRRLTLEAAAQAILARDASLTAEALLGAIAQGLPDPRAEVALAGALGLPPARARRLLLAFREEAEVEWPDVVGFDEGPTLKAWQYGTDFVIPRLCDDLDFASPWFRAEWVSVPRLLDLARAGDWSEAFVEAAVAHKGAAVATFEDEPTAANDRRDLVHLVWCHTVEKGEDGALARWQTVLCAAPGVTACGRELVRGRRGRFPAVLLARERNGEGLLASRGVAELASAACDLAKKLADVGSDNAIIGGLPPAIVKGADTNVTLNPLAVINLRPSSEIRFLQPPAYPAQGNNEIKRLRDELFDYFGLQTQAGDAESIAIRRRSRMAGVLDGLRELLGALLSVTQANASDGLLAQILGRDAALPGLREDIEGHYALQLEVNVDDLVAKSVIDKVQAFGQILGPMDRQRQVDTAPILRAAVRALFPDVGDEALRSLQASKRQDLQDEQANFVAIKAGLRPQMDVEGNWDYAARLAFWQRLAEENPAALEEMPPEARAFAEEWVAALRQQAGQFGPNAELGRTGSPAVAPMGAAEA